MKSIINIFNSEDASPVGKLWTGWSNWYGCHSMDADKWDDFPNNIAVQDRERIVDFEGFSKVRSSRLWIFCVLTPRLSGWDILNYAPFLNLLSPEFGKNHKWQHFGFSKIRIIIFSNLEIEIISGSNLNFKIPFHPQVDVSEILKLVCWKIIRKFLNQWYLLTAYALD